MVKAPHQLMGSFLCNRQKMKKFYSTPRFDKFCIIPVLILAHSKETMLFANVERSDIMVVVGVTRRIDDLGRITIPSEIRKTYQLDKNVTVEIIGTYDGILLRVPNIRITKLNEENE